MRLSRLDLLRYGHFEACTVDFPRGELDFHLVFGANEAGKSTTLAAVDDLLFGFPKSSPYAFRFGAPLLRVGGILEDEHGTLALRRRKGNKDTLLDPSDQKLSEARLTALLGGFSRVPFRSEWSLDHQRLREGGRAMVDARNDVSQALFSAGTGIVGAQKVLRELLADADAIWSERKAQTRSFWAAQTQLTDAGKRCRDAQLRPAAWRSAQEAVDRLAAELTELEGRRRACADELDALQRTRRLAGPVRQLHDLRTRIAAAGQTAAFDASHEALHKAASGKIVDAELRLHAAELALREAQAARDAIAPDRAALARAEAINDLVRAAGASAKALRDLPELEVEFRTAREDCDRLARDAGLPPAAPDSLLGSLPPPRTVTGLRARVAERQMLEARLAEARAQAERDALAREVAAGDALLQTPPPTPLPELEAASRQGQAALAAHDRLTERGRATADADAALASSLARLAPWQGDAKTLAGMSPPADGDVALAEAALLAADHEMAEAALASRTAIDTLARLELEAREDAGRSRAVLAEDLAASRRMRDAAWAALRHHLEAGEPIPRLALAEYEASVAHADRLADERFETAEASARLAALGTRTALARLDAEQAGMRHDQAHQSRASVQAAWHDRLALHGLPALTPAGARAWTAGRLEALRHDATLRVARRAEADDKDEAARARDRLLAASPQPDAPSLPLLVQRVQLQVRQAETRAAQRAAAEAAARKATEAAEESARRVKILERDAEAARQAWDAAAASASLPVAASEMVEVLPLLDQVRGKAEAAVALQRRIAGITRDEQRFAAAALALAADCGVTDPNLDPHALTERLRVLLEGALQDDRAAQQADATLDRWRTERDAARRELAAGDAALAPLLALADLPDRTALPAALDAARELRTMRDQLRQTEQAILAAGDFLPLETLVVEARDADLPSLTSRADALRVLATGLDADIAARAQSLGKARAELAALDRGAEAARAAADEAQARAALANEAEAYLLVRTQAVMLRRAVDRYREQQQHPMLARAGRLFATLTGGRYVRLEVDTDADPAQLLARSADERSTVALDGMSDGTADQLYLSLRLAALDRALDDGVRLPFLADDLFINFDDQRAHAGFRVLGEIARRTQVLFFTHHAHLRDIARDALHPHIVSACELGGASPALPGLGG